MNPPVNETVNISTVQAVLGSDPLRVYEFGEAPPGVALPYCVWQIISGRPENYLDKAPDADVFNIQVDVYGKAAASVRAAALALRNAFEARAYVTSVNGEFRDPDTKNFRYSFNVEFITER